MKPIVPPFKLDYDQFISLDAEFLAEAGIAEAYAELEPKLREFIPATAGVEEILDDAVGSYAVRHQGRTYIIYSPEVGVDIPTSWGRATFAFFNIVNEELQGSPIRFYAINGGNDLGGMFLTDLQALGARKFLRRRTDWPYLPEDSPPWYGEFH